MQSGYFGEHFPIHLHVETNKNAPQISDFRFSGSLFQKLAQQNEVKSYYEPAFTLKTYRDDSSFRMLYGRFFNSDIEPNHHTG